MEELSADFLEPELPPAENVTVDGSEVRRNSSFFQKGFVLNDLVVPQFLFVTYK